MPEKILRLVLGDQLNPCHTWFEETDLAVTYLLVEAQSETDYVVHHIQKLLTTFAAMRRFAEQLRKAGHEVIYVTLDQDDHSGSLRGEAERYAREVEATLVQYQEPDEFRVARDLDAMETSAEIQVVSSEHFFTTRGEVGSFFKSRKSWRMETFYRHLRKKTGILMDEGEPLGGAWNFDSKNRKPWPSDKKPPEPLEFRHDVRDLAQMLAAQKTRSVGRVDASALPWPIDREEALALLDDFVERLLPEFGPYQDALTTKHWALFHSRLAQALNMKMLSPREVVSRVEEAFRDGSGAIPIASAEGFIRQILGWREYVRGVYWEQMPDYAQRNALGAKRRLPVWFWTGDTKMNCQRQAIEQTLDHAYAHHIQRLMVTGNFALLAGIDPAEVDAWYLGVYIDAYEWVEMPNTRGMSQYADGGLLASKPYAASANYIKKQGDSCKTCFYDPKKRHGKGACPLNSLYWHFYERHRSLLEHHPRIGMAYRTWDKTKPDKKREILQQAEVYLEQLDEL